jgi:hypothetical protein
MLANLWLRKGGRHGADAAGSSAENQERAAQSDDPSLGPISSVNAGLAVESPYAPTNVAANSSVSEMFVKKIIA